MYRGVPLHIILNAESSWNATGSLPSRPLLQCDLPYRFASRLSAQNGRPLCCKIERVLLIFQAFYIRYPIVVSLAEFAAFVKRYAPSDMTLSAQTSICSVIIPKYPGPRSM